MKHLVALVGSCVLPLLALAHEPRPPGYGRDGPPSPAAQMQQEQAEQYGQRAREANRPSPALKYQQQRPDRPGDLQPPHRRRYRDVDRYRDEDRYRDQDTYRPIPESQRRPIVEEHYPGYEWQRQRP